MWPFSAGPAYAGTLILDGQVVLKDLPLEVGAWVNSLAEVSISCDKETAAAVWIDDLELKLQDAGFSPKDKSGKTLFLMPVAKEGFESYKRKEFPFYGGFVTSQELLAEGASLPVVDNYEYAAGMQSLRLKDGEGGAALIVKRFALPERFPFDTSDGNFAITNETRIASRGVVAAESREQSAGNRAGDRERVRDRISRRQKAAQSAYAEENRVREQESARNAVTQGAVGTGAKARTLSASAANGGSFYIYSYDGRLLAEYNGYDDCVKDYIYMGNRLLAEYKPQEDKMYFYTPDQINSTRIVTDSTGTVVYSAAHDPYGGMQKTWVNTYDPTPKFSGKERDAESGLDYFGARYYDKALYRFISVDYEYDLEQAFCSPQGWNFYSYCGNSPIEFIDSQGKYRIFFSEVFNKVIDVQFGDPIHWDANGNVDQILRKPGGSVTAVIVSFAYDQGKPFIAVEIGYEIFMVDRNSSFWSTKSDGIWTRSYDEALRHERRHVDYVRAYLDKKVAKIEKDLQSGKIKSEKEAEKKIETARKAAERRSIFILDWLSIETIAEWLPWEPWSGYFRY